MTNTDLLKRTLAHIEANPSEWQQSSWAARTDCGTAYCFAGWAVKLSKPDAVPYFESNESDVTFLARSEGDVFDIEDLAIDLLDIECDEADQLFAPSNSLDDLRRLVGELTDPDRCFPCRGTGGFDGDGGEREQCANCGGIGRTSDARPAAN